MQKVDFLSILNKPAAKNFASPSEGEAEGGCGGNSASPEPKRSPAVLLSKSRVPQKSFLYLLKAKIGCAQIKKCRENFFAGWRALASGGGAGRQSSQSGFSSKKVRILTKRHRHSTSSFLVGDHERSVRISEQEVEWRRGWDLNPRGACAPTGFRNQRNQPGYATSPYKIILPYLDLFFNLFFDILM